VGKIVGEEGQVNEMGERESSPVHGREGMILRSEVMGVPRLWERIEGEEGE
jgi:hypothetical protein